MIPVASGGGRDQEYFWMEQRRSEQYVGESSLTRSDHSEGCEAEAARDVALDSSSKALIHDNDT